MSNINVLVELAKQNGFECTDRKLRDDIVSEYTEIIGPLNTVEESVINKDISLLPVYQINEGLFNKNPYKNIIKEYKNKLAHNMYDYSKYYREVESKLISDLTNYLKPFKGLKVKKADDISTNRYLSNEITIISNNNIKASDQVKIDEKLIIYRPSESFLLPNKGNKRICIINDNIVSINCDYSYNLSSVPYNNSIFIKLLYTKADAEISGVSSKTVYDILNKLKLDQDPVITSGYVLINLMDTSVKYEDLKNSINYETYCNAVKWMYIFNPKVVKDINESYIEEGYAIELSTLKYVVESEDLTLEEAVQKIRDVNYIGDLYPMYCVLPEDINTKMTLESFITLYDSLNKSNIIPVGFNDISESEFIKTLKNKRI